MLKNEAVRGVGESGKENDGSLLFRLSTWVIMWRFIDSNSPIDQKNYVIHDY